MRTSWLVPITSAAIELKAFIPLLSWYGPTRGRFVHYFYCLALCSNYFGAWKQSVAYDEFFSFLQTQHKAITRCDPYHRRVRVSVQATYKLKFLIAFVLTNPSMRLNRKTQMVFNHTYQLSNLMPKASCLLNIGLQGINIGSNLIRGIVQAKVWRIRTHGFIY